jgi:hypothetical protein
MIGAAWLAWHGNIYGQRLDEELIKMAETGASPVETLGSGQVENRYQISGGDTMVLEQPKQIKLEPKPVKPTDELCLKEYVELAAQVGIAPPDLVIEEFKSFLNQHDMPVFNLQEVIAYMDEKAKKESKNKAGWHWCPLRKKDQLNVILGVASSWITSDRVRPATDYYHPSSGGLYDKIIPLHALKKVALIEKEFKHPVAFFACDYAPLPQLNPDPFLMVVINNPRVVQGEGRWIVDFWDEPGFGIEQMLK